MRILPSLLMLLAVALPASAAEVLRAPEPDWVVPAGIPAPGADTEAAAAEGLLFLLVDDQIAWNGESRLHHARRAVKVLDRAGLEGAASIDWDFAPDLDRLTLTRLQIRRGGQVLDLADSLRPELLRRETRLEAGILDGSLTAHYQIPDLRVGDVVDYSFLIDEASVFPGSTFAGTVGLEFGSPVVLTRAILNWPDGRPLHLGPLPDRVSYSSAPVAGGTRHEWRRMNHLPFVVEDLTPVEDFPDAALRYSASSDWGALVDALLPKYGGDLPLTPEWSAKVDQIGRDNPDDLTRATAALRLVQDQIRYVGIEIGLGGIVPRPPATVIAQGYGDCKDKSLLLRTVLARLGIEAEVALTDLDEGYALPQALPWVGAFDHMILRARIAGRSYWMDPTGSHEGGRLDHAAVPDYGFALPLAPGVRKLEPIEVPPQLGWNTRTAEDYAFGVLGVTLKVTSEFSGAAANSQRYRIATEPLDSIGRDLLGYYSGRYPGIREAARLQVRDDLVQNRLTTVETYLLPVSEMYANDLWASFVLGAEDFGAYYPKSLIGQRERPLTIGLPKGHHHTVSIRNAPVTFDPPQPMAITNPAFAYHLASRADRAGDMQIDWDFRTLQRVVPAAEVAAVIRDARKVSDTTSLVWNLTP